MAINGINSNAASWAQFVKLTQAARTRNDGLTVQNAKAAQTAVAPQTTNAVSFKRVADVYLSNNPSTPIQNMNASTVQNSEMNRRIAGGLFDRYA